MPDTPTIYPNKKYYENASKEIIHLAYDLQETASDETTTYYLDFRGFTWIERAGYLMWLA